MKDKEAEWLRKLRDEGPQKVTHAWTAYVFEANGWAIDVSEFDETGPQYITPEGLAALADYESRPRAEEPQMIDDEVKALCAELRASHALQDGGQDACALGEKAADMLETLRAENARLRVDAQAAVALMVERTVEAIKGLHEKLCTAGHPTLTLGQVTTQTLALEAAIRDLAPVDGLAMVEALRKERDADKAHVLRLLPLEADRDRLAADLAVTQESVATLQRMHTDRCRELAAAQAQIEALKAILHDAGALRDAADRVSEWFCTEARHLEGPRIQALRMAMVAYDRHMQPTALPVPNFSAGWPLEEGDGSIIVGAALPAKGAKVTDDEAGTLQEFVKWCSTANSLHQVQMRAHQLLEDKSD